MGLRIIVAEPNGPLLGAFRTCLAAHGFEVFPAANGLECVDALRTVSPDVLVLSAELPWGSGDGVLAMMQEETDLAAVPVLVMTSTPNSAAKLVAAFVDNAVLVKPVSPVMLKEAVGELVSQARRRRSAGSRRSQTAECAPAIKTQDESEIWI